MRTLELGDRVEIVGDLEWPDGTLGTIIGPDPVMLELAKPGEWIGFRRTVMGRDRLIVTVHVKFDAPTDDGSGDGPYRSAEVDTDCLRLLRQ
jgi:hypothetical protein